MISLLLPSLCSSSSSCSYLTIPSKNVRSLTSGFFISTTLADIYLSSTVLYDISAVVLLSSVLLSPASDIYFSTLILSTSHTKVPQYVLSPSSYPLSGSAIESYLAGIYITVNLSLSAPITNNALYRPHNASMIASFCLLSISYIRFLLTLPSSISNILSTFNRTSSSAPCIQKIISY